MSDDDFNHYPQDSFTPVEYVVETVLKVLDNETMSDAKGVEVQGGKVYGKAIEVNIRNVYFREQPFWCDRELWNISRQPRKTTFIRRRFNASKNKKYVYGRQPYTSILYHYNTASIFCSTINYLLTTPLMTFATTLGRRLLLFQSA